MPRSESAEEPQPGSALSPGRTPLTPEDEAILQRMMNDMGNSWKECLENPTSRVSKA